MNLTYKKRSTLSERLSVLRRKSVGADDGLKPYLDELFRLSNKIHGKSDAEIVASVEALPELLADLEVTDLLIVGVTEARLTSFLEVFRNRWCFNPGLKDRLDELNSEFWEVANEAMVGSPELAFAYRGVDLSGELSEERTVTDEAVAPLFEHAAFLLKSANLPEENVESLRRAFDRFEATFIQTQAGLM